MAKRIQMTWFKLIAASLFGLVCSLSASASSLKVEGAIESTAGGFVFPNGSVQITAALESCTPISSVPFVISEAGVYCLKSNLGWSSYGGNAISIEADNVVVDLAGWTLDGEGAGPLNGAIGIYAEKRKNITIRNGTIRGFNYGIRLEELDPDFGDSARHLIEYIHAVNNIAAGIRAVGLDIVARHNRVTGTGDSDYPSTVVGLGIFGLGCRVLDNDVTDTSGNTAIVAGIFMNSCEDAVISNNRVTIVNNANQDTGTTYGIYASGSNKIIEGNSIITADVGISTGIGGKLRDNLTFNVITPFTGAATDAGGND